GWGPSPGVRAAGPAEGAQVRDSGRPGLLRSRPDRLGDDAGTGDRTRCRLLLRGLFGRRPLPGPRTRSGPPDRTPDLSQRRRTQPALLLPAAVRELLRSDLVPRPPGEEAHRA